MIRKYHIYLGGKFLRVIEARNEDHVANIIYGYMMSNGGMEKWSGVQITGVYEGECSHLTEDRVLAIWMELVNEHFKTGMIIKENDFPVIKQKYIDTGLHNYVATQQSDGNYFVKGIGHKKWVRDAIVSKEGVWNYAQKLKRAGKILED